MQIYDIIKAASQISCGEGEIVMNSVVIKENCGKWLIVSLTGYTGVDSEQIKHLV